MSNLARTRRIASMMLRRAHLRYCEALDANDLRQTAQSKTLVTRREAAFATELSVARIIAKMGRS